MPNYERVTDEVAAAVFWRLVRHLQHRTDAQNVDLMGLAGFCRNCLSNWLEEAAAGAESQISREEARQLVYGMPYEEWKGRYQDRTTPEQLARMEESIARNQD